MAAPDVELAQRVLPEEECADLYDPDKLSNGVSAIEDKWKLLPAFLKIKGFVRQHIESFNYLVEEEMRAIMLANQNIVLRNDRDVYLRFLRIWVEPPTYEERGQGGAPSAAKSILPNQCRLRDITYSGEIKVDFEQQTRKNEDLVKRKHLGVSIGRIPMMLRSSKCRLSNLSNEELAEAKECPLDPGGYFIVKGVEKVALVQENLARNRILVETDRKGDVVALMTSSTHLTKTRTLIALRRDRIKLCHGSLAEEVNIMIILKGMGCVQEQEVMQMIGNDKRFHTVLLNTFTECIQAEVFTQQDALEYIGSKFKPDGRNDGGAARKPADRAADFLQNIVLCNIPCYNYNFRYKINVVGIMMRRLLIGMTDPSVMDNKDYYGNKRLELAGHLLSLLFEDLFKEFCDQILRESDSLIAVKQRATVFDFLSVMRKNNCITNGIQHAISSGNWFIKRFKIDNKGVTQVLCRYSYIAALGMMTRVASSVDAGLKLAGPRSLQPSQWGMLCPADTPEGEKCGLVKNLSLLCQVTSTSLDWPIADACLNIGVEDIEMCTGDDIQANVTVFVNGVLLGIHRYHNRFLRHFRELRRRGRIDAFASCTYNATLKSIQIACDEGRVCRPLIIIDNGQPRVTKKHLQMLADGIMNYYDFVQSGLIEYLDVNEENNCYIAMREENVTPQTTHLEIEPFTILGVVAGLVPFPHHNQSPRNTYQCAMGKQAMGAIAMNQQIRIDTVLYLLVYPQKPMVKTRIIDLIGFEQLPAGNNCMVAVMSYSGYDIEDAQIWNKSSIDRGLGRCMRMKKMQVKLQGGPADEPDRVLRIGEVVQPKPLNVTQQDMEQLDTDGIVPLGARVKDGDVLVNKSVPQRGIGPDGSPVTDYVPQPLRYKGLEAVVDQVCITHDTEENSRTIKVLLRETRQPEFGDKFSSRHGQKGVCGLIVPQWDLPFNRLGMPPDLIMNPHGFPSRMTVGKMIEMIAGKAGLTHGKHGYATIFGDQTERNEGADKVHDIGERLVKAGYAYHGKDLMTSGITGEQMPAYVFFGPIYYQKLKHMVLDKMHARSTGRRTMMTRQPTEGRSRGGGMRLGEMERDCLVGYGAAMLLNERLMFSSDEFLIYVCGKCGLIGYASYCSFCSSYDKVHSVKVPYACKLLFQEMMTMNIIPRLKLTEC